MLKWLILHHNYEEGENRMSDLFTLNAVDEVLGSNIDGSNFKEFSEALDQLGSLLDSDMYLEAVEDKKSTIGRTMTKAGKNTAKTMKDTAELYGMATDIRGGVIKTQWDLVNSCLNLILKVLGFLIDKIMKVPQALTKLIDRIQNIPSDIKNKIHGNIKLYITASDIQGLYTENLIYRLDTFISTASSLSQGNLWGTLFHKSYNINGGQDVATASQDDIKACKKLKELYKGINAIEFTQSVIEMRDPNNIGIYFSSTKSIKFRDLKGNQFEGSYTQALKKILEDISSRKKELNTIYSNLGKKYEETQLNQTFSKLMKQDQLLVTNAITLVSKVVNIEGNIVKYVMTDMNEINKAVDAIMKKSGVNPNPVAR